MLAAFFRKLWSKSFSSEPGLSESGPPKSGTSKSDLPDRQMTGFAPWAALFQNNFLGRFWLEIWIGVICLVLGVSAVAIPQLSPQLLPAQATSPCRQVNGHEVCIQRMKRSAKRYWEYRASVKVDGVSRPMERYDCRDRLRLPDAGTFVPYWQDEAVDVVCALFKQRQIRRNAPPASLGSSF